MRTVGLLWMMTAVALAIPASLKAQAADSQYYAAGNQYYSARNYSMAARYYLGAVKMNPNNAAAYQGLGNCYYAMGNKAYALAYYQKALSLQPGNAQLARFIQGLQGQTATAAPSAAAPNYLASGYSLLQQRQYSQAIRYFQAAIQQNPNDYKAYYYAGYAYVAAGDSKDGALYYEVAAAKSGNASTKAYADRVKATLSPDYQQWVDDQLAKFNTGEAAPSGATATASKGGGTSFGFHLLGGGEYIFADPAQIKQNVAGAYNGSGGVSLSGVTPNIVAFPELEPYIQLGPSFEINLAIGYFPAGDLAYTTYDYVTPGPTGAPDVWRYTFNTTVITTDLGIKLLFGDDKVKGYLGLSGGISPISMTFNKVQYDNTNTNVQQTDPVSGNYSTMVINGQALLGVDFSLGKGVALGPYLGYRYLSATNFQNNGNTLQVDTATGAVGIPGSTNFPASDPTTALTLDFSGLEGGINLTFSF